MMPPDHNMADAEQGCGRRLRNAREAAGLSIEDVATRLRMPVRVVESLEAEDWNRLGAPVYVRGQLRSYSRLLGLSTATMQAVVGVAPVEPVALVPRTYVPRMRIVAEQFAKRLVYAVITVAIALPVWLATRPHLATQGAASASLDMPVVSTAGQPGAPAVARPRQPVPLVASMAPVAQRAGSATAALELRLVDDSWVEITGRDGQVIEHSLLRAGNTRSFVVGDVGGMVFGNAAAVELRLNGARQDLAPLLRANVARFTVSSDGSLVPAGR
ncbi:helix-turn-helix domain-containing protein [Luteimonas sp. MC1782]|uniref:helix-turn-helix domain-containing protein n=1 Tax=Luteimonas sp. MC1782 TaxID=2760305 RepID=UPI00160033B8|nr:RodZ domain-containing protein [Luteimonas sp. MC1782]MBB1472024.1 helix-turn-helix domain-containing protein [Luteimonas sp. MC1782]